MILLRAGDVLHTVGKLSIRIKTMFQTSTQLEVYTKLWASKVVGILVLGISGFPLGSLGTK
jgi:hypothetical protein